MKTRVRRLPPRRRETLGGVAVSSLSSRRTHAMESFSEMQEAFSLTSEAVRGRSAASAVAEHVERAMRRADEIRPARDALAAADTKKRLGNDAFRAGDYLKAYSEYGEAHEALNVASEESTTSWEAERAPHPPRQFRAVRAQGWKSIRRRSLLPRRA